MRFEFLSGAKIFGLMSYNTVVSWWEEPPACMSSTLELEVADSSKMLVIRYQTVRFYNPEAHNHSCSFSRNKTSSNMCNCIVSYHTKYCVCHGYWFLVCTQM